MGVPTAGGGERVVRGRFWIQAVRHGSEHGLMNIITITNENCEKK